MSIGILPSPRNAVFTTALWDGKFKIADWQLHSERMAKHAESLRIPFPPNMNRLLENQIRKMVDIETAEGEITLGKLLRIELSQNGTLTLESRDVELRDEELDATTVAAPKWSKRISGTKHGCWSPYIKARESAHELGCDIAFLVHDFAIIDTDRAMPLVMDEDGIVWVAAKDQGGVESITFNHISHGLQKSGILIQSGRLNERLVARAVEIVVIGSGLGACRILSLDSEEFSESQTLTNHCQSILKEHYQKETTWFDVRNGNES